MKILDIAFKDLLRSMRNASALVFMFLMPLLTTGILFFAFGGLGGDEGEINMPVTKVHIANLDAPGDIFGGFSAGQLLVDMLQSEDLAQLVDVTLTESEADARAAVDNQEAGVALIIPSGFTKAAFSEAAFTESAAGGASITLYEDPTLTLGPVIVRGLVNQLVDGFSGMQISSSVVQEQLTAHGGTADAATMQNVTASYIAWAESMGDEAQAGGLNGIDVQHIVAEAQSADMLTRMMGGVMAGMLIFYAYFTGASTAQSIIQEDEDGTLARLFTTPTSQTTILGGKFVSVFLTLIVQVVVLMFLSTLIFNLSWGEALPVTVAVFALVIAAAGFGVFLMSFIKTSRQAGPVMGGVVTITGMAGGLMTTGFADTMPEAFNKMTLFTPQGWTLRTMQAAMGGGTLAEVLAPAGVTIATGVVLFVLGVQLFRKRFA